MLIHKARGAQLIAAVTAAGSNLPVFRSFTATLAKFVS
jgi:hypothetical protein